MPPIIPRHGGTDPPDRSAADFEGKDHQAFASGDATAEGVAVVDAVRMTEARQPEPATIALAWLPAKGMTSPIASARIPEQGRYQLSVRSPPSSSRAGSVVTRTRLPSIAWAASNLSKGSRCFQLS